MSTTPPSDLYLQSKAGILDLVTEENMNTVAPATPKWRVRDLIAHLMGSFEDFINGNTDGFAQPHWTAAHVERYADLNLEQLKVRWDEILREAGDNFEEIASNDIPDIAIHEFDIRGALGNTENRDSQILNGALEVFLGVAQGKFQENNLPTLKIVADDTEKIVGEGEPAGEIRSTMFELSRAFTGRRSRNQLLALESTVDLEPWVDHLSVMPSRDTDLVE